jgi:DNA-binding NarL/FixJ family response regulator
MPLASKRVLVVDDDQRVRAALVALLDGTPGLEVAADVGSVAEARAAFERTAPDAVLVDVLLPGRADGLGLIAQLSACRPVVAISVDGGARESAIAAGASAYLEKDGHPEEILAALGKVTSD